MILEMSLSTILTIVEAHFTSHNLYAHCICISRYMVSRLFSIRQSVCGCPSVCHVCIVSKWMNLSANSQCWMVACEFQFLAPKFLMKFQQGTSESRNRGRGGGRRARVANIVHVKWATSTETFGGPSYEMGAQPLSKMYGAWCRKWTHSHINFFRRHWGRAT